MRIRSLSFAVLLAAGTLFTAACGDDDDDNNGNTAGTDGGSGAAGSEAAGTGGSAGTGGDAGTGGTTAAGTGGGAGTGTGTTAFVCEADQTIKPGLNEAWTAGGIKRSFYATFPKDTTKPMAVVFWWHGYGGNAKDWEAVAPSPDLDPEFPFVVITPEDTDLFPTTTPQGLDWSIFDAKSDKANIEASLFEAVNGCLAKQYPINDKQLYVAGFSAGAIMTNLLATRYQGRIAASLAFSGAWFNDPEETKTINTLGFPVTYSWDALTAPSTGMVLITHGGVNDTFSFNGQKVIDFELCAEKADPFLLGAKRSYIECAHDKGHTPDPSITPALAIQYFKDHRVGEASPYLGGKLPAAFPASCTLHEP